MGSSVGWAQLKKESMSMKVSQQKSLKLKTKR